LVVRATCFFDALWQQGRTDGVEKDTYHSMSAASYPALVTLITKTEGGAAVDA